MRDDVLPTQARASLWLKVADAVTQRVGHDFLGGLVTALRDHMQASLAFITAPERTQPPMVRAFYAVEDGAPVEGFSYDLIGTPCELVYRGQTLTIPQELARRFPVEEGFEGYVGVPLRGEDGAVEGHLAVLSREPIIDGEISLALARMFAQRIETERRREAIERQRDALIADLGRMNARLRRRYHTVHEANAFKTRLMGVIAHDLRNPLAAILAQGELIATMAGREPPALEKIEAASGKVVAGAERMAGLIDATLKRVRKDMSELALERAETDLAAMVRMAIEANAEAAAAKRIAVNIRCAETLRASVDEELMLEAVDNLISNAIKYSYPGGEVLVDVKDVGAAYAISVADLGQGLTEADLARVFGRFKTLSAKPTGGETATGLGLANVKEIVEAHGGAVRAESEGAGRGAVFTIELPRPPAPA